MYALTKCDWFPPRIACDCVCRYSPLTLKKETACNTKKGVINTSLQRAYQAKPATRL